MKVINAHKTFVILWSVALIVTGCNKAKQDSSIRQIYQVDFNKHDSSAIVMAWFTVNNGTRRVLFNDRSFVKANGKIDSALFSSDPTYFSWRIDSIDEVIFSFRKNNDTFTNKVSISSIDDITLVIDSVLSVADTIRASFIGSPIKEGEIVGMSVNRNYDTTNLWSGIGVEFSGQRCTLDFSKTKDFHPGTYTILISRTKSIPLQQADGGGIITVSITDLKTVLIK